MKRYVLLLVCFCTLLLRVQCSAQQKGQRILVFTKTTGFRHASIPDGVAAIQKLGREQNLLVDTSANSQAFSKKNLRRYKAVILMSTTGNIFDSVQQKALQQFVEKGGGLLGVHAAADAECDWPWYLKSMGACFESHPQPQTATLVVLDSNHPSTRMLPKQWNRFDEWYNFKALPAGVQTVMRIDESSYTGGKHADNHPMVWWQKVRKGKVMYTALGHTSESYTEPLFLQHLSGAIQFVLSRK